MATHHPSPSTSRQPTDHQLAVDTGQFPEVMFISHDEFVKWTSLWQQTMSGSTSNVSDLFLDAVNGNPATLQQGVCFDSKNLLAFLSTVGLYTIHARFGIRTIAKDDSEYRHFKLILFGRDRKGDIVTPYMVGYPLYNIKPIKLIERSQNNLGEVPVQLAKQWILNWKGSNKKESGGRQATSSMFIIPNVTFKEPLQGYTYQMREFLNTLFMDETTNEVYAILGLHQYPTLGFNYPPSSYAPSVPSVNTFGLLFLGIHNLLIDDETASIEQMEQLHDRADQEDVQATAGYYDFSAPCPGTC